jgi:acyl carrier protein
MGPDPRADLRECVATLLRDRGDEAPFGDDDALISSGRLDSLAVVEIVSLMETRFAVDFAKVDFDRDAFESISAMARLVSGAVRNGWEPS